MIFKKRRPPVGSSPGTYTIGQQAVSPRIQVLDYSSSGVDEFEPESAEELLRFRLSFYGDCRIGSIYEKHSTIIQCTEAVNGEKLLHD